MNIMFFFISRIKWQLYKTDHLVHQFCYSPGQFESQGFAIYIHAV